METETPETKALSDRLITDVFDLRDGTAVKAAYEQMREHARTLERQRDSLSRRLRLAVELLSGVIDGHADYVSIRSFVKQHMD